MVGSWCVGGWEFPSCGLRNRPCHFVTVLGLQSESRTPSSPGAAPATPPATLGPRPRPCNTTVRLSTNRPAARPRPPPCAPLRPSVRHHHQRFDRRVTIQLLPQLLRQLLRQPLRLVSNLLGGDVFSKQMLNGKENRLPSGFSP